MDETPVVENDRPPSSTPEALRMKTNLVALLVALVALACQKPLGTAEAASASKNVRSPASAGTFYPSDAKELAATVKKMMDAAPQTAKDPVKMILTPHAGLEFSGQTAANAFKQLAPGFERVVIVAGNHSNEANYDGASPDTATHYAMPGLEVKVAAVTASLVGKPGFSSQPQPKAHSMHMVEIELPFLAYQNGGKPFEIVPLVVGHLERQGTRQVATELAKLADAKTVFVFSVDLSHYYTYDQALALDKPCLDALVRTNADDVARCDTDATQVLMTMLELAARLSLSPRLLSYTNSGETPRIGDKSRVVGYGAMTWEDRYELGKDEQQALLTLARRSLEAQVKEHRTIDVPAEVLSRFPRLATNRGAFVTLREDGDLRGCIGSLGPTEPLAEDVVHNAVHAAVHDSRFEPVRPEELAKIHIDISVLDTPRPLNGVTGDALVKYLGDKKPGLIISYKGRRSTFLPAVWEELAEPLAFLGHLCRKQGSPEACWREADARFETYGSQLMAEPEKK
jgi:AmmeMemoRadiSam system protein A/AmmeMemoRadiSam system protein B